MAPRTKTDRTMSPKSGLPRVLATGQSYGPTLWRCPDRSSRQLRLVAVIPSDTAAPYAVPRLIPALDIAAKTIMVLLLVSALIDPSSVNLEGKAASARAVSYPLLAFAVPMFWYSYRRDQQYPWLIDLMVTIPCFSDLLGNRMGLYESVWWFDDLLHFVNTGLLAGAAILFTKSRTSTLGELIERGVAVGLSAAVVWEIGEYFAFLSKHAASGAPYADTLADIALGGTGSVLAAILIHRLWQSTVDDPTDLPPDVAAR